MKKKKYKSPMEQVRKPVPRETQIIKSKKRKKLDKLVKKELSNCDGFHSSGKCASNCPGY